jgi:hypothetical protein
MLAFFGVIWLIGHLYPNRVQPVAEAFGVVAGAFLPVYLVAAAVGIGAWAISKFSGALFHHAARPAAAARVPVAARAMRGGYAEHPDDTPAYVPATRGNPPPQPPSPPYQPGGRQYGGQGAGWAPPARESWEQPVQPGWGAAPAQDPRQPAWNQPRPWDAPDPSAPPPWNVPDPNAPRQGGQRGQGQVRGDYPPVGPDDPTQPHW